METEKAVFLEFEDEMESMVWKKKSDKLDEIVEETNRRAGRFI